MALANKTVAFIGCGAMGGAVLRGLITSGCVSPAHIVVSDPDSSARAQAAAVTEAQLHWCGFENAEALRRADIAWLGVKPHQLSTVFGQSGKQADATAALRNSHTLISVLAGVSMETLAVATHSHAKPRIARVMPNLPCVVGEMAGGYCCSDEAVTMLLEPMLQACGGQHVVAVKEELMDAVTGLAGGGPAYAALVIESLADGGVKAGIPRREALRLAAQTLRGTATMLLADPALHPGALKDAVCSARGTTIRGVAKLEEAGVRSAFIEAVDAATKRSKELGHQETKD